MNTIVISTAATMLVVITAASVANIWSPPPIICYACRWAVTLWLGTASIGLYVLAYYVH